jgi:DNA polymerase-4
VADSKDRIRERTGLTCSIDRCRASRGFADRPLVTGRMPRRVSRETTLERDICDEPSLLDAPVISVAKRRKARGLGGRNVTVKLRYADFDTHTHGLTLPRASDDARLIGQAARVCLARCSLDRGVRLPGARSLAAAAILDRGISIGSNSEQS